MEDMLVLNEKYSDKKITTQINKVISRQVNYDFYILYPESELNSNSGNNALERFYRLSINQLNDIKQAQSSNQCAKIIVKNPHNLISRKQVEVGVNYAVLFGFKFEKKENGSDAGDVSQEIEPSESVEDRDNRLFKRAVELVKENKLSMRKGDLDKIHCELIKEEKGKSNVTEGLLKRSVQRGAIIQVLKSRKVS